MNLLLLKLIQKKGSCLRVSLQSLRIFFNFKILEIVKSIFSIFLILNVFMGSKETLSSAAGVLFHNRLIGSNIVFHHVLKNVGFKQSDVVPSNYLIFSIKLPYFYFQLCSNLLNCVNSLNYSK